MTAVEMKELSLEQLAARIESAADQWRMNRKELGLLLLTAKEKFGRGNWQKWVKARGIPPRTASEMMRDAAKGSAEPADTGAAPRPVKPPTIESYVGKLAAVADAAKCPPLESLSDHEANELGAALTATIEELQHRKDALRKPLPAKVLPETPRWTPTTSGGWLQGQERLERDLRDALADYRRDEAAAKAGLEAIQRMCQTRRLIGELLLKVRVGKSWDEFRDWIWMLDLTPRMYHHYRRFARKRRPEDMAHTVKFTYSSAKVGRLCPPTVETYMKRLAGVSNLLHRPELHENVPTWELDKLYEQLGEAGWAIGAFREIVRGRLGVESMPADRDEEDSQEPQETFAGEYP